MKCLSLASAWGRRSRSFVSAAGQIGLLFIAADTFSRNAIAQPTLNCAPLPVTQRALGGALDELMGKMRPISDGGAIVVGTSASNPTGQVGDTTYFDGYAVRLDAAGNRIWERFYGETNLDEQLFSVVSTADGGFLAGGQRLQTPQTVNQDFWIVRLDADGNQLWERAYGGDQGERLTAIEPMPDGGFLLGGWSWSGVSGTKTSTNHGQADFWVVRIDAAGNSLWDRSFGGNGNDALAAITRATNGRIVLGGSSDSDISGTRTNQASGVFGGYDFWLVTIDANGNFISDLAFGSTRDDELRDLQQAADGDLILGGYSTGWYDGNKTADQFGGKDFWVIRLDPSGNRRWDHTFGGFSDDDLFAVTEVAGGGFILGGFSYSPIGGNKQARNRGDSDIWLVRIDQNGLYIWDQTLGGTSADASPFVSVYGQANGQFVVAAASLSNVSGNKTVPGLGQFDLWFVKTAPETDCDQDGVLNDLDLCSETPLGTVANTNGCSLEQLCPCTAPFESHTAYVACVTSSAAAFTQAGLITESQRAAIVLAAENSNCPTIPNATVHFGLTNAPVGGAEFGETASSHGSPINITIVQPEGTDGAIVYLGQADAGIFIYPNAPIYADYRESWYLTETVYGRLNGVDEAAVCSVTGRKPTYEHYPVDVNFTPLGVESITLQYYSNNVLVVEQAITGPEAHLDIYSGTFGEPRVNPFWRRTDGSIGAIIEFTQPNYFYVRFDGVEDAVQVNRVFFRANNPTNHVDYISRAEILAGGGFGNFIFVNELLGVFRRPHQALGPIAFHAHDGRLAVRVLPGLDLEEGESQKGVHIELDKDSYFESRLEPVTLHSNGLFQITATDTRPENQLFAGLIFSRSNAPMLSLRPDFSAVTGDDGTNTVVEALLFSLKVYRDGALAGTIMVDKTDPPMLTDSSSNAVPAIIATGARLTDSNSPPQLAFTLDRLGTFIGADGATVVGNHARLTPEDANGVMQSLGGFSLSFDGPDHITIVGESSDLPAPRLTIRRQGGEIFLSWPLSNQPFILEASPSWPGGFQPVTGDITFSGGQYHLTLPVLAGPGQFFRLRASTD